MAPVNACADNTSCDKTFADADVPPQCFGGSCVGARAVHPILVVTVPENPPSPTIGLGGMTFALPETYETVRPKHQPSLCRTDVECDFLPPLSNVTNGNLLVSPSLGVALWPPSGLRPAQPDSKNTSLPIHAVLHPMWTDASGNLVLASKLGLPLGDIRAVSLPVPFLSGPTTSPKQKQGYVFSALVPSPLEVDASGSYLLEVVPDAPFGVFPPYVSRPVPAADLATADPRYLPITVPPQGDVDLFNFLPAEDVLNPPGSPPVYRYDFEFDEAPGAPSLAGWTAHIDDGDGRRVSGLVTLPAGATKQVAFYEATGTSDQSGETLFVDPPGGVDLPRLEVRATATSIVPTQLSYPALAGRVQASGFVFRSDTPQAASATVVFYANGQDTGQNPTFLIEGDGTTSANTLAYVKRIATTSAGQWATTLPPGTLRAYVIPDDPTLALTVNNGWQLQAPGPTVPDIQNGKTLVVNPRAHVRGRVILPDGTPVYAADVVIDPSADDPLKPSSDPNSDPLARPREVSGQTDAFGRFDIPSDPGLVDISIRPRDGTRLPWVFVNATVPIDVASDAGAATDGLTIPDVVVPLPTPFVQSATTGVLTDSLGNPLPGALIRAYAFPASNPTPDGGAPLPHAARQVGATVTDATGLFQLFVTEPSL
jgi:hypothetical protein